MVTAYYRRSVVKYIRRVFRPVIQNCVT